MKTKTSRDSIRIRALVAAAVELAAAINQRRKTLLLSDYCILVMALKKNGILIEPARCFPCVDWPVCADYLCQMV